MASHRPPQGSVAIDDGRGPDRRTLDKSTLAVREMFAAVAPRYDRLNHLLSASLDRRWRRLAAQRLEAAPPGPVLDLCSGTGDQAIADARGGRRVAAVDSCLPMLDRARRKVVRLGLAAAPAAGDALALPFAGGIFAAVTVSFGIRNIEDPPAALREMRRVLAPSGRLLVLELTVPVRRVVREAYLLYFRHVLPAIASVTSPRGPAYRYLRDSVLDFPQREAFRALLVEAGFVDAGWLELSGGTVCLYEGTKNEEAKPPDPIARGPQ